MSNLHSERIDALRKLMRENGWEAVVISGSDPHSSEYPAPRWQQVKWLTGFTGEAGDLVVTDDHAGLWTDSRYFIQAAEQLEGTGVQLHKTRQRDSVYIPQWLASRGISRVAVDGLCWNVSAVEEIESALSEVCECPEVTDVPDLLDSLWSDRPAVPVSPIATLDVECFGGVPRGEKIGWLRRWMLLQGVDRVLLTSLDEIAWILNVRGSDIEYNPLVISYLLVSQDHVRWFVRKPVLGETDPDTEDSFRELEMDEEGNFICLRRYFGEDKIWKINELTDDLEGHGGGDHRMIDELYDIMTGKTPEVATSIDESIESHYMALAAEESRLAGGQLIQIEKYRN